MSIENEVVKNEATPTDAVTAASQTKVLVTDAKGRIIAVHKLTALNYYHLTKAMGESATNESLMDLAVTVAGVRRIDTTDFPFPSSERDVEFVMQVLDFDGLKAAGDGIKKLNPAANGSGAEAAKNSAGSRPSS